VKRHRWGDCHLSGWSIGLLLLLVGLVPSAAAQLARSDRPGASPVRVGPAQQVQYVFAVGVPVHVEGVVHEDIVVVGGDVTVAGTARIDEDVYVLGGELHVDPAAHIQGSVTTISRVALRTLAPNRPAGAAALGIVLLVRLLVLLAIVLAASALSDADFAAHQAQRLVRHPLRVLSLGVLWATLIGTVALIASVTIIGVPLAFLLVVLLGVEATLGLAFVTSYLREPGRLAAAGRRRLALCLALLELIPLIGEVVLYGAAAIGLGVTLIAIAEAMSARRLADAPGL
jgi:hypothetical protein